MTEIEDKETVFYNTMEAVDKLGTSFKMIKDEKHVHAPFTLFSSVLDKEQYDLALALQTIWNKLVVRMSEDYEFIDGMEKELKGKDSFVVKLHNIERKYREKRHNEYNMAILRSDYMIQNYNGVNELKHIEINTISASFAPFSERLCKLRQEIFPRQHIVVSDAYKKILRSISLVHHRFCIEFSQRMSNTPITLMIVCENESNIYDQNAIIEGLFNVYKIQMIKLKLSEICTRGKLDESGILCIDACPVSIVYFRAGYRPEDFDSKETWMARDMIERSSSVKCPSLNVQLVGMKKAQELFCRPHVLDKYLDDHDRMLLKRTFVDFYSFDKTPKSTNFVKYLIENEHDRINNFILKPQREGGGNNMTGKEMLEFLKESLTNDNGIESYILMSRIFPPVQKNILVKECPDTMPLAVECISELGVYGIVFWRGKELIDETSAGYLLRSKPKNVMEGGVCSGHSYLDTVCFKS